MLENFHVENFRALKDLTIEKTARINLIVGGNNVGKTSLLEAMYFLLASPNEATSLESAFRFDINNTNFWEGVNKSDQNLRVVGTIDGNAQAIVMLPNKTLEKPRNQKGYAIAISLAPFKLTDLQAQYQSAYDKGVKPKLIKLLKKIDGSTLNFEPSKMNGGVWTIKIENDSPFPVDISSMGQGFTRAFGLYCRLLASDRKIALIDEVEIGMHHNSLPVLWDALREASGDFDIQIFATTHSYECIKAAVEAFKDVPEMFQLIRLVKDDEGVKALCFSAEEIDAALSYSAEVR